MSRVMADDYSHNAAPGGGSFDDLPPPPYDDGQPGSFDQGPGSHMHDDDSYLQQPGGGGPGAPGAPGEPGGGPAVAGGPAVVFDGGQGESPGGLYPQVQPGGSPGSAPDPYGLPLPQQGGDSPGASPFAPPRDDDPMPSSDTADLLAFPRAPSHSNSHLPQRSHVSSQPMVIAAEQSLQQSSSAGTAVYSPGHSPSPVLSSGGSRDPAVSSSSYDRDLDMHGHAGAPGSSLSPGGPSKPGSSNFDTHAPPSREVHHEDEVKTFARDDPRASHHGGGRGLGLPQPAVSGGYDMQDEHWGSAPAVGGGLPPPNNSGPAVSSSSGGPLRPAVVSLEPGDSLLDDDDGRKVHSDFEVSQAFTKLDRSRTSKIGQNDLKSFMKRHKIVASADEIEGMVIFSATDMHGINNADLLRAYRAAIMQDDMANVGF